MGSVTRGVKKCFFSVRFLNQNQEMDPKKMPTQTLSDIEKYRFCLIYPIDLQNFAIMLLLEFMLS